jgi:hypothetical protein
MSENATRMTARSQLFLAALAALVLGIGLLDDAARADQHLRIAHSQKYRRVAYSTSTDTLCRTGWWQTLTYGHVRPRWGTFCY